MKSEIITRKVTEKVLVKKCHCCGHILETAKEASKCPSCKKSFLPLNYFAKVHAKNSSEFKDLFLNSNELHEDDLIKGVHVLW